MATIRTDVNLSRLARLALAHCPDLGHNPAAFFGNPTETPHGWLLAVPDDPWDSLDQCLGEIGAGASRAELSMLRLLVWARDQRCDWLLLGFDEPLVAELPRMDHDDGPYAIHGTTTKARVRWMLELSTRYLPVELRDDLGGAVGVTAYRWQHGWIMWVPDNPTGSGVDDPDGSPDPLLLNIQQIARDRRCDWVQFDEDLDQPADDVDLPWRWE